MVDNTGSSATITNNIVTGAGTINDIAQNGIQISRGANATFTGNTITGNSFHREGNAWDWGSAGILLYNAGNVTLAGGNTISDNDQNLYISGATSVTVGAEIIGPSSAPLDFGYNVINFTNIDLDLSDVTFDTTDNFEIEDRIWHGIDDPSLGLATWVPNNFFVTTLSGTIQTAVDAADDGDTVNVAAGTYIEEVVIDKPLSLVGPNAGINPYTGTRVAEAIIQPTQIGHDPYATCIAVLHVNDDNVTVDGITLDGNNPALTSGYLVNGIDVDACEGIVGFEGVEGIRIENNIAKNFRYTGIDFSNDVDNSATSGNYIRYNFLNNLGNDWGIGVVLYNNFYADVSYNVFEAVRVGVQTGNFHRSNPGTTASIHHNTISSWRRGIFHNLHYSDASAFTINSNTLTVINSTATARWDTIMLSSLQTGVDAIVTNNTIIGSDVTQMTVGYQVWNTSTAAEVTITGGSVSDADYGVWINNYAGYGPSNGASSTITVDEVSITRASLAGVYVQDDPLNTNGATVWARVINSPITFSANAVLVEGPDASATGMCNLISDNTAGVNNTTSTLLDFEKNWWGSPSGPAGVGLGSGGTVSANVDYKPWNLDTTCTSFASSILPVITEGASISVGMSANGTPDPFVLTLHATDVDSDVLTWDISSPADNGTASVSGTGNSMVIEYTPDLDYNGTDQFVVRVTDADGSFDTITVNVTITSVEPLTFIYYMPVLYRP